MALVGKYETIRSWTNEIMPYQKLSMDVQRIKEVLRYDPETGDFWWRVNQNPRARKGQIAGTIRKGINQYRQIKLDNVFYLAHRMAWWIVYNEAPDTIDHINGNGLDNRISNLRSVTSSQNMQNHHNRLKNKTGLPPGTHVQRKRFSSQLTANGKYFYLGSFDTPGAAHEAYMDARKRHHDAPGIK